MASTTMLLLLLMSLLLTATVQGDKKKTKDKIVIHVPYKIHNHHHIHTKYKVITVPSQKKENTVIYLKEQPQPVIAQVPAVHTEIKTIQTLPKQESTVFMKEQAQPLVQHIQPVQTEIQTIQTQSHAPQSFIAPHQESAGPLLESISQFKTQNQIQTDQHQAYSTIKEHQKFLDPHLNQNAGEFVPSFAFKPYILPPQQNFIHDFSFKPIAIPPPHYHSPKLLFSPKIHPSFSFPSQGGFIPKIPQPPVIPLPQNHFYKTQFLPTQKFHDNIAFSSNQFHNKLKTPRFLGSSYEVKEETHEEPNPNTPRQLQPAAVPYFNSNRKGKPLSTLNHRTPNLKFNQPNKDYEHVGYLIINGNSRKVVGKNFKDELRLSG